MTSPEIPSATAPVDAWSTYKRLLQYVRPFWYGWCIAFVGFVIAALSQLAWAELVEWLLETVDQQYYERRWWIAGTILLIFIVRGGATFVGQYAMSFVSVRVVASLRKIIFDKLLALPYHFHQQQSPGRIISLVTYNTEQLSGATTDAVRTLLQEGLLVVVLLGYLFYVNWQLSLLFLVLTPLIGVLVSYAAGRLKRISGRIQRTMGDVAQVTGELVHCFQVVKSFCGESVEAQRFETANRQTVSQSMKLAVTSGLTTPLVQGIVGLQMAVLIAFALNPDFLSEVGAPQFMAYITAAGLMVKPAKSLTSINAIFMRGVASAEQIFQILDQQDEYQLRALAQREKSAHQLQASGDFQVEFNSVDFRYAPDLPLVLNQLSFTVAKGEMVALVGKTGSGKTTITDLLLGFFPVTAGEIFVSGEPLDQMALEDLRLKIALVPQFSHVFQGTIRDNIAYGSLQGATLEAVQCAAKMAHAHEFIVRLPQGYDTPLGEGGVQLSGGQRQRLAIARAILKKSPILVMDEATSALDNESERHIQTAMTQLKGETAMIVVAHRLSTIEAADRILVIDQGRVIESGDHQTLLAQNGAYASLYAAGISDIE